MLEWGKEVVKVCLYLLIQLEHSSKKGTISEIFFMVMIQNGIQWISIFLKKKKKNFLLLLVSMVEAGFMEIRKDINIIA